MERKIYNSDRLVRAFVWLAVSYLLVGLFIGVIGGFQYLLPPFLREQLSFQKSRPLHVYLVISWIFTGAQAGIYYYIPRIAGRDLYWLKGGWLHFSLQLLTSILIIGAFYLGKFSGREYLEFPPWLGAMIMIAWIPFAFNFFLTLRPDYRNAPVYIWSWSAGIIFFFITMMESYLWIFDFFRTNIVRDITVQWKALGSMVGSWNMLVYGCSIYIMERMSGDTGMSRKPLPFFFFFLGLANLMFNWGHHTYIVPAAGWVKTVAYVISMTELLILGHIIYRWRKTLSNARKNYHIIPFRLLSFADVWIFLNLSLAIIISIPALNYYTHGTHITVAHAMGSTIGINTMLLFASIFYVLHKDREKLFETKRRVFSAGLLITNLALVVFWFSLIGSGFIKIAGKLNNEGFYMIMKKSEPVFRVFLFSGIFLLVGLSLLIFPVFNLLSRKAGGTSVNFANKPTKDEEKELVDHLFAD
jgi:nitric oxide reductase subunit B